jgi:hypothetical protein
MYLLPLNFKNELFFFSETSKPLNKLIEENIINKNRDVNQTFTKINKIYNLVSQTYSSKIYTMRCQIDTTHLFLRI